MLTDNRTFTQISHSHKKRNSIYIHTFVCKIQFIRLPWPLFEDVFIDHGRNLTTIDVMDFGKFINVYEGIQILLKLLFEVHSSSADSYSCMNRSEEHTSE